MNQTALPTGFILKPSLVAQTKSARSWICSLDENCGGENTMSRPSGDDPSGRIGSRSHSSSLVGCTIKREHHPIPDGHIVAVDVGPDERISLLSGGGRSITAQQRNEFAERVQCP